MSINERFKFLINELYLNNKRSFSMAIGVNPTVIENIVGKRGGNPSFEVVQKVLFANANISADWLILGNGSMLRDEKKQEVNAPEVHIVDNNSMGFILDRYEALAAENGILKKEIEDLKRSRNSYTNKKIDPPMAAEPEPPPYTP